MRPPAINLPNAERWATLEPLVDELLSLPPAVRSARLNVIEAGDVATARALRALLQARDEASAHQWLAGQAAPISICYPYAALEPLLPRLSATAWYAEPVRSTAAATHRSALESSLQDVKIPLRAVIGTVDLPVEALAALQPGDVIRVDERVTDPIELAIADDVRTWALPGRVGDRMALQLVTSLRSVED